MADMQVVGADPCVVFCPARPAPHESRYGLTYFLDLAVGTFGLWPFSIALASARV